MTCEEPGLAVQCRDILSRAGAALEETGCGFDRVVRASFYLHRDADLDELLEHVRACDRPLARGYRDRAG